MKFHLVYVLFILSITIVSSCKEGDEVPKPTSEELFTNDSIIVKDLTIYKSSAPVRGQYHLLGYGYDITGENADSAYARKPVIDIEKMKNTYPSSVEISRSSSSGASVYNAGDAAEFSSQLSNRVDDETFFGLNEEQNNKFFKGEIVNYFSGTNPLSSRFVYGGYKLKVQYKTCYMMTANLYNYAYPAFEVDAQTSTPAELVNKYGTHILTRINLGSKLSVIYQAETGQKDRIEAADLGLSVALAKIFRMFSGSLDYLGVQSATGNFSQRISFKASGGDVSKIQVILNPQTKLPVVDVADWGKSMTIQNSELIDIQRVVPLYEAIADPVRKDKVKKYIEHYLTENAVVNQP